MAQGEGTVVTICALRFCPFSSTLLYRSSTAEILFIFLSGRTSFLMIPTPHLHLFNIGPSPLTRQPISGCDNRSKLPSLKMGKGSVSVPFCCLLWYSSLHLSHWKISSAFCTCTGCLWSLTAPRWPYEVVHCICILPSEQSCIEKEIKCNG